MKKGEKKSGVLDAVKGGITAMSDVLFSKIFSQLQASLTKLEERLVKKLFSSMLVGFGIILLLIAGFFYLLEFAVVSKTTAFISLGAAFIIIGYFLKYLILKEQRGA